MDCGHRSLLDPCLRVFCYSIFVQWRARRDKPSHGHRLWLVTSGPAFDRLLGSSITSQSAHALLIISQFPIYALSHSPHDPLMAQPHAQEPCALFFSLAEPAM